jgi:hypothetical protein
MLKLDLKYLFEGIASLIKNLQVISIKFEKGEHTVKIKSYIICIFLVSTSFNGRLIHSGIFKDYSNISRSQRETDVRVKCLVRF